MAASAIIPLLLLLAVVMGFLLFEARKVYWDRKISDLCRTEGGVTVYERVELSEEEFRRLGGVRGELPIPEDPSGKSQFPYFTRNARVNLAEGRLQVTKWESVVMRRADGKALGKVVGFFRRGGDFPMLIGEPTSFSCDGVPGVRLDVERQIFLVTGINK